MPENDFEKDEGTFRYKNKGTGREFDVPESQATSLEQNDNIERVSDEKPRDMRRIEVKNGKEVKYSGSKRKGDSSGIGLKKRIKEQLEKEQND